MGNDDITIDGLTIEIQSSAKDSSKGIDAFVSSLEKLYNSVNKNLNGLNKLKSSLSGITNIGKSFSVSTPAVGNIMGDTLVPTDKTEKDLNKVKFKLSEIKGLQNSINKYPLDIVKDTTLANIKNLKVYATKLNNFSLQKQSLGVSIVGAADTKKHLKDIGSIADNSGAKIHKLMHILSTIGNVAQRIGSGVGSMLIGIRQKLTFGLIPANQGLVKTIRQTALALIGVRGLFTATRKAINEYMNYDTALSESLQRDWAIIGSVVAPIIERLVNLVATLTSYIAALIKTFFGVDIVARANEKALKGTAKGASSAKKSVKDLNDELGNLADFDKLHTISFPDDSGSSGSGSSGITPLTLADVDTSWIDELKKYIDADDYFALGVEVATKLEEGLRSINWENIQSKLLEITDNITSFLNGFTYKIDGKLIGYNLAQVFNTAFGVVNEFFANYHWDILGDKLHESLKSMIETIDWEGVGTFLSNGIKAAIDILYEVFDPSTFYQLGKSISDSIEAWFDNIDWNKVGATLSDGIRSVTSTLQGMFQNLNSSRLSEDINNFLDGVEWDTIAQDISNALTDAFNSLSNVLDGIDKEKLFNDFETFIENINWLEVVGALLRLLFKWILIGFTLSWANVVGLFKSVFKSVFKEDVGEAIIDGLKGGIEDGFPLIFSVFWSLLKGILKIFGIDTEDSPSSYFNSLGENIVKGFKQGIGNLWNKTKEIFEYFKDKVGELFGEATEYIKEKFNIEALKEHAGDAVEAIKDKFRNIAGWFKDVFSDAWQKVKEVFSSGGKIFDGIKDGISDTFREIVNKLIDGINRIIKIPFEKINGMLNRIKDITILEMKPFNGLWGYNPISIPEIPKLATGTNKIESEGIYHLHEGESVIPKKYNPAINSGIYDKANEKLINEMKEVKRAIDKLTITNVVKIGEDDIYKKQTTYNERKMSIYGTS